MSEYISIGHDDIKIWPVEQSVEVRGHESIMVTEFSDNASFHRRLIDEVLKRANDPNRSHRLPTGLCGEKIYDISTWGIPEATLIDERAKELFRHAIKCDDAIVDISWASVYCAGDYCMPHSHLRTMASIVYFLDSGYSVSSNSLDGRFCFVDPRIERCCEEEAGRMTNPFVPSSTPGTMILFPSPMVHCVNPYFGNKPRITLSWDIDQIRHPEPDTAIVRPGG